MHTPEQQAAYIADLEGKIDKLQAQIAEFEVEVARLKKEKGLTREDLVFNNHTGLYADKRTGELYCPTCVGDEKRNPLMTEKYVWRCTVGGHRFSNPDAPSPNVNMGRGGGGPDSWMKG
jgi:hypothetical protein